MAEGVLRVWGDAEIAMVPLADGGEGTLEALMGAGGGIAKTARVRGPLGDAVEVRWGILPDGRGVIEMAQASGLTLLDRGELRALEATSFGTGQLIKAALDAGCRELVIGVGGSATSDGGAGALQALGLRMYDERQRILPPGGGTLEQLETIDTRFLDPRLAATSVTVLCDVTNPLHGPHGAARVYGPQKGASPAQVQQLDRALARLAEVTARTLGRDERERPGAGAAGGLAFGLMAFCRATLRGGIDFVLEANDFARRIEGADLILTGEGALDAQTLSGKAVGGVCRLARQRQIPVIGFGGAVRLSGPQLDQLGLLSAFSLAKQPCTLDECIAEADPLLALSVERALRLLAPYLGPSDPIPRAAPKADRQIDGSTF